MRVHGSTQQPWTRHTQPTADPHTFAMPPHKQTQHPTRAGVVRFQPRHQAIRVEVVAAGQLQNLLPLSVLVMAAAR